MSNSSVVYARIDSSLKEEAEAIMSDLGVTPTALIQMVYRQIVLTKGIPFEVRLPGNPVCVGDLSDEQLMDLLAERVEASKVRKTYSKEEFKKKLEDEFCR
ncbi:MAG: type II toxin-antitoxin system RelB/DinJ family antitoxin [Clostridia bacterium]|nr:type II toxin-antitoxin system RelB/DinJ family antitoxin [Clostridia bacterium]